MKKLALYSVEPVQDHIRISGRVCVAPNCDDIFHAAHEAVAGWLLLLENAPDEKWMSVLDAYVKVAMDGRRFRITAGTLHYHPKSAHCIIDVELAPYGS